MVNNTFVNCVCVCGLVRNGMCCEHDGEFLFWSIDILVKRMQSCEKCQQTGDDDDDDGGGGDNNSQDDNNNDNDNDDNSGNNNNNNNTDEELTAATATGKRLQSSQPTVSVTSSTDKCSACEDCSDLLELSFGCLFGYRKRSTRYAKSQVHTAKHVAITLENARHLYTFFKPHKLPEYDDLQKLSISVEV